MLPGKNAIFRAYPSEATPTTMKRLERRERIVFALLNGCRAIQDVARLTHQSDISVARIIVELYRQGYIEYIRG
jgi:Mn-dependent DtxR family transcriptional regulator